MTEEQKTVEQVADECFNMIVNGEVKDAVVYAAENVQSEEQRVELGKLIDAKIEASPEAQANVEAIMTAPAEEAPAEA